MSFLSSHRPEPEPPQPSTVVADPATPEACRSDWDDRAARPNMHPSSYAADPHTFGRKS